MGNTILSEKLLRESIDYYNELKSLDCVVKNSMPIVFFGDIDNYIKQDYRIITAALNPSDVEFLNNKNDDYSCIHRFPDYNNTTVSLEKSCKNNTYKYEIIHYKGEINGFNTSLLWGSAQNTPFQPFKSKIDIGERLKKYFIT